MLANSTRVARRLSAADEGEPTPDIRWRPWRLWMQAPALVDADGLRRHPSRVGDLSDVHDPTLLRDLAPPIKV